MRNWNYILAVGLALLPVLAAIYYACMYSFGGYDIPKPGFTMEHWKRLFSDPALTSSIWFSIKNSLLSLCITIPLAFVLAHREYYAGRGQLPLLYFLPLSIPPIVAGYLAYKWLSASGWLSRILFNVGVTDSLQDFPNLIFSSNGVGIIIVHGLLLLPFFTLLIHAYYQKHNIRRMRNMSLNLGVSSGYFFWKVTLPLVFRTAAPMILLYFILLIGTYEVPLLIGGQHPKMISIYIVEKLQRFDLTNMPQAYAVSLLFFIMLTLFLFLLMRFVPKRFIQRL
jgi:putative spermidine/putrescine transport system permease protein